MSEEPDVEAELVQSAPPRFVLVTGAGRSGTSTIAGSLNLLGLHLPRPVLRTNDSNPRGFYESKWAIEFHRGVMDRAAIDTFDARPTALRDVQAALRPGDQDRVENWLRENRSHAPQIVVKDPRSAWMPGLWADAAEAVGMPTGYVIMLRHPAEVIGSRSTYYAKGDATAVRRYQVVSVARWVNAHLITERQTRNAARAFVRYGALIADWRAALAPVRADLDLTFNTDLTGADQHPVDSFIDPALRRHEASWDELDIPSGLQDIAEETWQACGSLADRHGQDDTAQSRLDDLSQRYEVLFGDAEAIAHDVATAAVKKARRKAVRETRAQQKKQAAPPPATGAAQQVVARGRVGLSRLKAAARGRIGRRTG